MWAANRLIDSSSRSGRVLFRILRTPLAIAKRIIKTFFLDGILNGYFFILKVQKKGRGIIFSGRHRILSWLNSYIYRLTIIVIVVITIGNNLFTRPLNAEELQSQIIFGAIFGEVTELSVELVKEGPITAEANRQVLTYLDTATVVSDELIPTPFAPDTDDDSVYATTEGDSAIIAPVITDTQVINPAERDKIETYTVQGGDNISTISQRFGININTLLWENNLTWNSTIRPGQKITILPVSGVAHTVKSGETISGLAKKYQVDTETVIEYNKLSDASDIQSGDSLVIPNGIKPTAVALRPRQARTIPNVIKDIFIPDSSQNSDTRLLWPLSSRRITQYFHLRHKGIDVGDTKGNPIYAAEAGRVERAGWNDGFGYNVVVNHGNGLKTLYAHVSRYDVEVGDAVSRGQAIARIGSTGWSTGPHLHFEVISNGRTTNPLNYIR